VRIRVIRLGGAAAGLAVALGVVALGVSGCGGSGIAVEHPSLGATSAQATSPSASATASSAPALPLAGKVVGIDPGHNGRNFTDPSFINHLIWNGRESETCDTTGTETDGGYTEARFNFNVATYLRSDLTSEGARVVMTRTSNDGVGPCVTERSEIINRAHADVAIDIHADGGPPGGRGFAILEPVADGPNDKVIKASVRFGDDVRSAFLTDTTMPTSSYDGTDGVDFRDNLAGLNLTTVPKVLIECGNMRNATDAGLLVSASYQQRIARALAAAITEFLGG
jgi:N-acetylmuramoyl-L-alanine amidase